MKEYLIPSFCPTVVPWAWWEDAFSDAELNWLQDKAKKAKQPAVIGLGEGSINYDTRRSDVEWLTVTPESIWVFERMVDIAARLNADHFHFDLERFEAFQLTNYDQSVKGMYGWHVDFGSHISRKLSFVLQLSDPSEYEGGELQLSTADEPMIIPKQRGLVVAFPSFCRHQVTPVTRGNRQTLVAWASGPGFR
jgi:PKHD-type hydroxylase